VPGTAAAAILLCLLLAACGGSNGDGDGTSAKRPTQAAASSQPRPKVVTNEADARSRRDPARRDPGIVLPSGPGQATEIKVTSKNRAAIKRLLGGLGSGNGKPVKHSKRGSGQLDKALHNLLHPEKAPAKTAPRPTKKGDGLLGDLLRNR
jgi:hypothetical protein